jgi:hypothetical protein
VEFLYLVYGLRVRADHPIPGLVTEPHPATAEVRLWIDSTPNWAAALDGADWTPYFESEFKEEDGTPTLAVWTLARGEFWKFRYSDGKEFLLDSSGTQVCSKWPQSPAPGDLTRYLIGPILGILLRLRGLTCLHASSIVIRGRAVALAGLPGTGKSTAAAVFARRGFPVLADDIAVLRESGGEYLVEPGYPRLNLWPYSVESVFGAPEALPLITPNWDKRFLPLEDGQHAFERKARPLAAVYILAGRIEEQPPLAVSGLRTPDALLALIANTYANYILDARVRAPEFAFLGRVAGRVPVRRIAVPEGAGRIAELCDAILDDFSRIADASPRTAQVTAP